MGNDEYGPETAIFFVGTTDGVNFVTLFGEWLNPNGEFRIRKGTTKVRGFFKNGKINWVGTDNVWTKITKPNFKKELIKCSNTDKMGGVYVDRQYLDKKGGSLAGLRYLSDSDGMVNIAATDDGNRFYGLQGFKNSKNSNQIDLSGRGGVYRKGVFSNDGNEKITWDNGDTWEKFNH